MLSLTSLYFTLNNSTLTLDPGRQKSVLLKSSHIFQQVPTERVLMTNKIHLSHISLDCGCWFQCPRWCQDRGLLQEPGQVNSNMLLFLFSTNDSQVTWGKANLSNRWETISHFQLMFINQTNNLVKKIGLNLRIQ